MVCPDTEPPLTHTGKEKEKKEEEEEFFIQLGVISPGYGRPGSGPAGTRHLRRRPLLSHMVHACLIYYLHVSTHITIYLYVTPPHSLHNAYHSQHLPWRAPLYILLSSLYYIHPRRKPLGHRAKPVRLMPYMLLIIFLISGL